MEEKKQFKKGDRVRDKQNKIWVVQVYQGETLVVTSKGKRHRLIVADVELLQDKN